MNIEPSWAKVYPPHPWYSKNVPRNFTWKHTLTTQMAYSVLMNRRQPPGTTVLQRPFKITMILRMFCLDRIPYLMRVQYTPQFPATPQSAPGSPGMDHEFNKHDSTQWGRVPSAQLVLLFWCPLGISTNPEGWGSRLDCFQLAHHLQAIFLSDLLDERFNLKNKNTRKWSAFIATINNHFT